MLTGVHGLADALQADTDHRPDLVLGGLADLWDSPGRDRAEAMTRNLHEAWAELDAAQDDAVRHDVLARRLQELSPAAG